MSAASKWHDLVQGRALGARFAVRNFDRPSPQTWGRSQATLRFTSEAPGDLTSSSMRVCVNAPCPVREFAGCCGVDGPLGSTGCMSSCQQFAQQRADLRLGRGVARRSLQAADGEVLEM